MHQVWRTANGRKSKGKQYSHNKKTSQACKNGTTDRCSMMILLMPQL